MPCAPCYKPPLRGMKNPLEKSNVAAAAPPPLSFVFALDGSPLLSALCPPITETVLGVSDLRTISSTSGGWGKNKVSFYITWHFILAGRQADRQPGKAQSVSWTFIILFQPFFFAPLNRGGRRGEDPGSMFVTFTRIGRWNTIPCKSPQKFVVIFAITECGRLHAHFTRIDMDLVTKHRVVVDASLFDGRVAI